MSMRSPLLSILVPTIGRPSLRRTLASIRSSDVEVIVVADGPNSSAAEATAEARQWIPATFLETETANTWGHLNCQEALRHARGRWLMRMDDDDIFCEGAIDTICSVITDQGRLMPHLFRFMTPERRVIWEDPPRLMVGQVGTPSLVTPNLPYKLGRWVAKYDGDFDFIKSTTDLWGQIRWREELICITRPTLTENWTGVA